MCSTGQNLMYQGSKGCGTCGTFFDVFLARESVYIILIHTHIYIVCICFCSTVPQVFKPCVSRLYVFDDVPQCSTVFHKSLDCVNILSFDEQFISRCYYSSFSWESHGDTLGQDAVNASALCEFSASGEGGPALFIN